MFAAAALGLMLRGGGAPVMGMGPTSGGAPVGASPEIGVGRRFIFWRQGRGSAGFFSGSASAAMAWDHA